MSDYQSDIKNDIRKSLLFNCWRGYLTLGGPKLLDVIQCVSLAKDRNTITKIVSVEKEYDNLIRQRLILNIPKLVELEQDDFLKYITSNNLDCFDVIFADAFGGYSNYTDAVIRCLLRRAVAGTTIGITVSIGRVQPCVEFLSSHFFTDFHEANNPSKALDDFISDPFNLKEVIIDIARDVRDVSFDGDPIIYKNTSRSLEMAFIQFKVRGDVKVKKITDDVRINIVKMIDKGLPNDKIIQKTGISPVQLRMVRANHTMGRYEGVGVG